MTTTTKARHLAKRFECRDAGTEAGVGFSAYRHTHGYGTPKRTTCLFCGGKLVTHTGLWGVFKQTRAPNSDYLVADVIATFSRRTSAERRCTADDSLVIRWIYVFPEETS